MRANNREEFLAAAARVRRLLESPEIRSTREPNLDQMLVEGYIPGREVAVEGLLTDGNLRVLAIFDKPDPLEGPYFEETIYVTPSRLPDAEQRAIEQCTRDAARALGLSHGPIHAEFRINDEGIWPLEVAPRPIGGLCARALRFHPAREGDQSDWKSCCCVTRSNCREPIAKREALASGVMMIPVPKSGVLKAVTGEDAARAVPGVTELLITARLHDYIAAWPEGSSYLGFLFARGNGPEEVEQAIRRAHEKLVFTLTPRLPVEHPATRRVTSGGELAFRFRRDVSFGQFRSFAEEKLLHLFFHDFLRIGIERIQPVLVHDHLGVLQPQLPGVFRNVFVDALANLTFPRECGPGRRAAQIGGVLTEHEAGVLERERRIALAIGP